LPGGACDAGVFRFILAQRAEPLAELFELEPDDVHMRKVL
jgi:hypothetical protein